MNQTLRIAYLDFDDRKNPLLAGGQSVATYEVARRLVRQGHEVSVYCSRYPGSKDRVESGIHYRHVGIGTKNIRLNNLFYILSLPFVVPFLKEDVVVECFTSPISTLGTPLFTRKPVVAIPTSFDASRFSKQYKFPFFWIERSLLPIYSYFLPFTREIEKKFRLRNTKAVTKIVPNGVSDELFAIRPQAAKHILFLGRLEIQQKGLDLLLDSYALIAKSCRFPLIIAGTGPDEEEVRNRIRARKLEQKVRLVGMVKGEQKKRLFAEAAFVVVPSREESFCLVALEALASSIPVLAFSIPGLSWAQTKAVVRVRSFQVQKYADKMQELCGSYRSLRKQARTFASKFSWDHTAQEYVEFFQKIKRGLI